MLKIERTWHWWRILGPGAPRHVYPSSSSARADLEDGIRRDASGIRARLWRLAEYPTREMARRGVDGGKVDR